MDYSERTRMYEVLVRYRDDGTVAAHQRTITEVVKDGKVIAATEGPATPLDPKDVADVVGDILPAIANERDAALSAQANAEKARDEAMTAKESADTATAQAIARAEAAEQALAQTSEPAPEPEQTS